MSLEIPHSRICSGSNHLNAHFNPSSSSFSLSFVQLASLNAALPYIPMWSVSTAMDTPTTSQQANWQNNIYILNTTRVLMALGLTFLIRSLYQLYQRMRTAGGHAGASGMYRTSICWMDALANHTWSLKQWARLGLTLRLLPWEQWGTRPCSLQGLWTRRLRSPCRSRYIAREEGQRFAQSRLVRKHKNFFLWTDPFRGGDWVWNKIGGTGSE